MQRRDADGVVLVCDFCRRDWDGQEPMIEGHHGSIICLECLKTGLKEQRTEPVGSAEKYKCTLCLRFNIPRSLPHWSHGTNGEAVVCQECMYQAAKAFTKDPNVAWRWDPAEYPPPVKTIFAEPGSGEG